MPGVQPPDCVDVREKRSRGEPLSPEEARHAASCPVCSGALAGEPIAPDAASLFANIERAVESDRGLLGRLRSRPTRERVLLATGFSLAIVLGIALASPRSARGPVPTQQVVLALVAFGANLLGALQLSLLPLQKARPGRQILVGVLLAGLALPVVFALLPTSVHVDVPAGVSAITAAARCFGTGALAGVALIAALFALDRQEHRSPSVVVLAAVAGGLTANAALELHCAVTDPSHLLLGHASIGLVLVAVYSALRRGAR